MFLTSMGLVTAIASQEDVKAKVHILLKHEINPVID